MLLALELIPDLGHAPVVVGKNSKQLRVEVAAEIENRLAALRDRIDQEAPSSTQAPDLDPETLAQFSTPLRLRRPDHIKADRSICLNTPLTPNFIMKQIVSQDDGSGLIRGSRAEIFAALPLASFFALPFVEGVADARTRKLRCSQGQRRLLGLERRRLQTS